MGVCSINEIISRVILFSSTRSVVLKIRVVEIILYEPSFVSIFGCDSTAESARLLICNSPQFIFPCAAFTYTQQPHHAHKLSLKLYREVPLLSTRSNSGDPPYRAGSSNALSIYF